MVTAELSSLIENIQYLNWPDIFEFIFLCNLKYSLNDKSSFKIYIRKVDNFLKFRIIMQTIEINLKEHQLV